MTTRAVVLAWGLLLNVGVYSVNAIHSDIMHAVADQESLPAITLKNLKAGSVPYPQDKISNLVKSKIEKRERFFGVEISVRSTAVLDYGFFKTEPLFTSIVWFGEEYANIEPLSEAPAVKLANILKRSSIVLPHITCYNMTMDKLDQLPLSDLNNALVLRGDKVDDGQEYKHAVDLVREIRKRRKDDICIGVGGHPVGHPDATSREEDLRYLKEKVDAGADLIITQIRFVADDIVEFIKECRRIGIKIPIIPGIYIPRNLASLNYICKLCEVCPPEDEMREYVRLKDDEPAFQEYALSNGRKLVQTLLESDERIYGVHFFTLNYFDNIGKIVEEFFS